MTTPDDFTSTEEENTLVMLPHHAYSKHPSAAAEAMLPTALSAAVPLWVSTIYESGGPTQEDWVRLPQLGQQLAERGDQLLYRSPRAGETAERFNTLAKSLALLSFVAGGVSFGDQHFDAQTILSFFLGAEKAEQYVAEVRRRDGMGAER